ncbi:MAG: acyl-CoA thioesterase [Geminicoccaceae bacterium]
MFGNRHALTIEWGDCDPAGIVYFPRYLALFDNCTWALFTAALGRKKGAILAHYGTVGCPMVDLHTRFLRPCTFGDEVVVESRIEELRRSSFAVAHRLLRGGELAVEGRETRVWSIADPEQPGRIRSEPIPAEVRTRLGG